MGERERGTIILLSHEYPPYVFGGVATYSKQLAEWLSHNGWRVFVMAGKASKDEKTRVERIDNRLTIIRVYFPEIPPRWFLYTFYVKSHLEVLLKRGVEIVLSNSPLTWLTLKGLRKFKRSTRLVSVFHGSLYSLLALFYHISRSDFEKISLEELAYYTEAPLINRLTRKDLLVSERHVFIANHVAMEFESLYKDLSENIRRNGLVVYPGVEYDLLVQLRRRAEEAEKDKMVIAYVGRLYHTKGVTHAIKVVENLIGEVREKEVELWMFGKGPLEPWLKHYLKKRKLLKNVRLFGFVERSKSLSLMAKYVDVLLHPSLYEGAPLAVMEAQALGIPVVAYDLPWAREFIIDGVNGYKARYPDTAKLAEGVVKAARLNASAVMLSAEKYDRKRTLRKLESVLE
jgi:glycosyltransferase involved in cell wall biosynthesis